jgi:dolichol kinase
MISKGEVIRQCVHFIYGILIIILTSKDTIDDKILYILGILGLVVAAWYRQKKIPVLKNILKILGRERENRIFPLKGLIFFTFGSALTLTLYERDIALASIMILTVGDSVSRLTGPRGKLKLFYNRGKNLEGSLGGALVAILGSQFFVPWPEAILGSAVAMLAEGLEVSIREYEIDDNLYIPPLAGLVIWLKRVVI